MISTQITSFIAGVVTIILLLCRRKRYDISVKVILAVFVIVGGIGYLGACVGAYFADSVFLGMRFYGKVVFVIFALWLIASLFKIEKERIMDLYAPVDIFALAIMKVNCMIFGCCGGITLCISEDCNDIVFPSQMFEFAVALTIGITILLLERNKKYDYIKYPFYLLSYGTTRYFFDFFREDKGKTFYIGNYYITCAQLFCIVIIIFGLLFLVKEIKRRKLIKEAN